MLMVTHQEGSVSISVNCTGSSFTHCSVVAWQPVRPCLSVTLPSQPACHIPKAHSVSCAPGSLLPTTGFIPRHSSLSQTLLSVCHNWLCFWSFSSSRSPFLPNNFAFLTPTISIQSKAHLYSLKSLSQHTLPSLAINQILLLHPQKVLQNSSAW